MYVKKHAVFFLILFLLSLKSEAINLVISADECKRKNIGMDINFHPVTLNGVPYDFFGSDCPLKGFSLATIVFSFDDDMEEFTFPKEINDRFCRFLSDNKHIKYNPNELPIDIDSLPSQLPPASILMPYLNSGITISLTNAWENKHKKLCLTFDSLDSFEKTDFKEFQTGRLVSFKIPIFKGVQFSQFLAIHLKNEWFLVWNSYLGFYIQTKNLIISEHRKLGASPSI